MNDKLLQLKQTAEENAIPIMMPDAINYIKKIIETYKIEDVLEIGTATGYSAINFALVSEKVRIVTIEKDQKRFIEAVKNVKSFNLSNRIELVLNDALKIKTDKLFDLIIIDAAKSKNIDFFDKYKDNLKKGGIIITDNINFHGLVGNSANIEGKNLRNMVKKIEAYLEYLKTNKEYETLFLNIGDGLAVSKKRGKA